MAEIRSQDKRDKLRLIVAQLNSPEGKGKTLGGLLLDALKVCDEAINGGATPGTWLSSTGENGGSAGFSMLFDYSPSMAKRLIGELLDSYDYSKEQLGPDAADADIADYMMKSRFAVPEYAKKITRFRSDYTTLRYGTGYDLGTNR